MTSRNLKITAIVLAICLISYFILSQRIIPQESQVTESKSEVKKYKIDIENLKIEGRKVIGLVSGKEKEMISKIKVSNRPTDHWDDSLEEALRTQGGESLKEVIMKSVDTFVWTVNGMALFVESVIVTIKNSRNEETTFRVLVDSQTGKILKNWDQPIYDPVNPRDNFKIKIDPRYHSENGH
jgi:hypothetical protein